MTEQSTSFYAQHYALSAGPSRFDFHWTSRSDGTLTLEPMARPLSPKRSKSGAGGKVVEIRLQDSRYWLSRLCDNSISAGSRVLLDLHPHWPFSHALPTNVLSCTRKKVDS